MQESPLALNGRHVAKDFQERLRMLVGQLTERYKGYRPGLCVIRVGEIPASLAYIRQKRRAAEACGFVFHELVLPEKISQDELKQAIQEANKDARFQGVIVQLPLPAGLEICLSYLAPEKNVDGLYHSATLAPGIYTSCTALGVVALLQAYGIPLQGQHAVVVGRSFLVGRPLAALLLDKNATVTLAHRHTHPLASVTSHADILCVAAGVKGLILPYHVKTGAVVVDIGIHVEPDPLPGKSPRLFGDVDPSVANYVSALSPVPGGVGPMTVVCLLYNTLHAAYRECGEIFPAWI